MARLYKLPHGDFSPNSASPFIGFIIAGGALLLGAVLSGHILALIDIPSFLIVVGGTIGATLVQCSIKEWRAAMSVAVQALTEKPESIEERIGQLMSVSHIVRKEGVLACERMALTTYDPIFKKACELTADGTTPEEIHRIVAVDAASSVVPLRAAEKILTSMGEYAPGLGLVGTLLGLVQMLGSLDNSAAVGSAMAVALLTTLYGATISYVIFFPLAARVSRLCENMESRNRLTIEGMARIAGNENTVLIEQRLKSFLVNG